MLRRFVQLGRQSIRTYSTVSKDPYKVLGLAKDASSADIKKAYFAVLYLLVAA